LNSSVCFEGLTSDVYVYGYIVNHRGFSYEIRHRAITFYTAKHSVKLCDDRALEFPFWNDLQIPDDAMVDYFADNLIITLRSDWVLQSGCENPHGKRFLQGSLLVTRAADFIRDPNAAAIVCLFEPTAKRSMESHIKTKDLIIVETLDNVKSRLMFWEYAGGKWLFKGEEPDAVIRGTTLSAVDSLTSNLVWLTTSSFISPTTLYLVDAMTGPTCMTLSTDNPAIKALPPQFPAHSLTEVQLEAISADGTSIPYFLIAPKSLKLNGTTPTLLYGYGGFEISLTPSYSAVIGSTWLNSCVNGGINTCYVVANIRGGGEFGPSWHQAALKENRKLAYDDFIAVAEDLIRRGVTCPQRLAIRGGSNGGLLVGNVMLRRPDLFGAVVCQVPLLNMKCYHKLLAGASWMAEYGDPDKEEVDPVVLRCMLLTDCLS
jgi:prolyl oligopeptidase